MVSVTRVRLLAVCGALLAPALSSAPGRADPAPERSALPPLDLHSASSLLRSIARGRAQGQRVPGIAEVTAHRLALRTFPDDRLDERALAKGAAHAANMPPAPRRFKQAEMDISPRALGNAWQSIGPINLDPYYQIYMGPYRLSGRVNAAAFEPYDTDSLWVATSRGGVWKSPNLGLTWTCLSNSWATNQTSSIAICPANGYIAYVGTGAFEDSGIYPDRIYKTTDGGSTWNRIGPPEMAGLAISAITVDPDNVNIVMAAAGRGPKWDGGVWRSEDAGLTWTQVLTANAPWSDLKYGASAGVWRYYHAICLGNSPEMWRSNDRGLSWTRVPLPFDPQFEDSLRVAPSAVEPWRVYLLSVRQKRVWRSDDAGAHWVDITKSFGETGAQAGFNAYLTCTSRPTATGPKDVLYAGGLSTWVCLDPASAWPTWQDLGRSYSNSALMHADQHCMAVAPYNPQRMLVGTDGGAYLLHFNPTTNGWTVADATNAGLVTIMANRVAVAMSDPFRILCGNQDNANSVCRGEQTVWTTRFSGDGSGVAIHPLNPDTQYCAAQGVGILQTKDNWNTQKIISPDTGSDRKGPFTHIALDPSNPGLLYTGTNYLWRWNDHEQEWDARLGNTDLAPVSGGITAIAIAPSAGSHPYAGTLRGELWVSVNYGDNWTYIADGSPALPSRSITSIAVDPSSPRHIYVTLGGTPSGHLYHCADVLGSPRVWQDLSGTGATALPSAHHNCVALDTDFPTDVIYVATDIGVFVTLDGGAHWSNATIPLGLPVVEVTDLKIANGHLYASTYGRGIWRIPVLAKGIQLTYPNGFETLPAASNQTVQWHYRGPETGRLTIDLLKNGQFYRRIAESISAVANGEELGWTVPEDLPLDGDYAIRAVTLDEAPSSDTSDAMFAVSEPERITVTAPNGGESWSIGQSVTIQWTHTGDLGATVRIDLMAGGAFYQTIAAAAPIGPKDSGMLQWTVPTNLSTGSGYAIRVTSVEKPYVEDTSNGTFTGADTITLTSPNGGENWAPGSVQTVRWCHTGRPGNYVSLKLYKAGAYVGDIVASTPIGVDDKGQYSWTLGGGLAPGVDYTVRIASVTQPQIGDESNAPFCIGVSPTETLLSDASAEYEGAITLAAILREADGDPVVGRTVVFTIDGLPMGEATTSASGLALLTGVLPAALTPGTHVIVGSFAGDAVEAPSSGQSTCFVSRAQTALDVPDAAGAVGTHAVVSATLRRFQSSQPLEGRRVRFLLPGGEIGWGVTDAAGRASCMFRVRENEPPGTQTLEAIVAADTWFEGCTGSGAFTVTFSETRVRPADAVGAVGSSIVLQADLVRLSDGLPLSGRILRFEVAGAHIGDAATGPNGVASLLYTVPETPPPGEHPLVVSFAGDSGHLASTGTAVVDALPANTTLWTVSRTGTITEPVTLRQYDLKRTSDNQMLTGKTITYKVDGTTVGTATTDAGGDSTCNWTIADGPASRTITAEFAGDAAYNGSSGTATLTCQSWSTKMVPFPRTARITDRTELKARLLRSDNLPLYGKPINFYVDGTFIITRPTNVDGYASYPYYDITDGAGAGVRTILSEWAGNGGYAAISKTATLTVNRAIPYIWVLPKTIPQGAIANLYAYFRRLYDYQKQAGKTVDFKIDGTVVQTVVTDGVGVARYLYQTTEPAGVYTIRCEFYGDAWLEPGYGEANLTIY